MIFFSSNKDKISEGVFSFNYMYIELASIVPL